MEPVDADLLVNLDSIHRDVDRLLLSCAEKRKVIGSMRDSLATTYALSPLEIAVTSHEEQNAEVSPLDPFVQDNYGAMCANLHQLATTTTTTLNRFKQFSIYCNDEMKDSGCGDGERPMELADDRNQTTHRASWNTEDDFKSVISSLQ